MWSYLFNKLTLLRNFGRGLLVVVMAADDLLPEDDVGEGMMDV